MAKSNENEIALFFGVTPETVERLKAKTKYLMITQSECYSKTDKGLQLTNRVRRTEHVGDEAGTIVYEAATKYRLPNEGTVSRSIEIEKEISKDEYEMALPFGDRIYQKRRIVFSLGGLEADLDWYFDKALNDFGSYCKLDVNTSAKGLSEGGVIALLKSLPQYGITISDLINPPWVFSDGVKTRIGQLMAVQWNLAR